MKLELIATATFGLEAVVKREIEQLGYKILRSEDAKITFLGDERAVARCNLWLRSADRVLIKMAEFKALEFEDLFQQTKGHCLGRVDTARRQIHGKRHFRKV